MTPERIARVAYAANEGYRAACGEPLQGPWDEQPAEYRDGIANGVKAVLSEPNMTAEESHERWLEHKRKTGWHHGVVQDNERKIHPNMKPYYTLSEEQKAKDALFMAVVRALA